MAKLASDPATTRAIWRPQVAQPAAKSESAPGPPAPLVLARRVFFIAALAVGVFIAAALILMPG
jgi:hypothetical protein